MKEHIRTKLDWSVIRLKGINGIEIIGIYTQPLDKEVDRFIWPWSQTINESIFR